VRFLPAAAVLLLLAAVAPAEEGPAAPALPAGWSVLEEGEIGADDAKGVGTRLGAPVERLWNSFLSVNGLKVKVNRLRGADEAAARAIEAKMLAVRGSSFVGRHGNDVLEVVGANVNVARAVFDGLGVPRPTQATYEVSMRLGCVDKGDDNRCNDVFLLFLALAKDPTRADLGLAIEETTASWTFGKTLRLVAPRDGWFSSDLTFTPAPLKRETVGALDVLTFEDLPKSHGIPYVDVSGTFTCHARFRATAEPRSEGLLEATPPWPAEAKDVRERAEAVVAGATGARERVLALLRHVALDVRYDGPVGSRHGVPRVMAQKFGRCWDKSDLLVTLCRAVKVPARQVAGWVPSLDGGHVWTEVHLDGEGWIPVDATCTWLGTSEDYIPLFQTSDGHMPILHLAKPTIRRRD
jgi:hypothetical protein